MKKYIGLLILLVALVLALVLVAPYVAALHPSTAAQSGVEIDVAQVRSIRYTSAPISFRLNSSSRNTRVVPTA